METTATTTAAGVYELLSLIPGPYQVSVELTGFKRLERGPLELRTGDVLPVDPRLELGAVTESASVTAATPLLESATASLGQVIDRTQIRDLPLPNDNLNYLMLLIPGVSVSQGPTRDTLEWIAAWPAAFLCRAATHGRSSWRLSVS